MATQSTPKFHNDMGIATIEIGAREFECIGANPPFDHPHVFLDMGDDNEMVCPYCSTLYKHDPSLGHGEAPPSRGTRHRRWLKHFLKLRSVLLGERNLRQCTLYAFRCPIANRTRRLAGIGDIRSLAGSSSVTSPPAVRTLTAPSSSNTP